MKNNPVSCNWGLRDDNKESSNRRGSRGGDQEGSRRKNSDNDSYAKNEDTDQGCECGCRVRIT